MKKWLIVFSLLFSGWLISPNFISGNANAAENAIDKLIKSNELAEQSEHKFLDRDQAFQFSAVRDGDRILARWKIANRYYLYQERFKITVTGADMGTPIYPKGEMHYDEFAERDMEVFFNFVEVAIPISNITSDIKLKVRYQGCSLDGLCYTPATKTKIFVTGINKSTVSTSAATLAATSAAQAPTAAQADAESSTSDNSISELSTNQNALASYLNDSSVLVALGLFLLLGIALTFTPCVFPMLPILASIVAGQGKKISTHKAFWLSFVYVQGMAVTYVALGVLTAAIGHSLAGFFQSIWVVGAAVIIFVLLALSMFGFYDLKLPSALQSKLSNTSNKLTGGTFAGVALMGFISALIVSPCMTAPLAGVLLHIANTGNYWLGALYMYALAMGIGIPLIIIGVSEGKLMPKAGSWMDGVKAAFGVAMLAVAIYISDHLLPGPVVLILWGVLMLMSGIYLGALEAKPENNWLKFWKGIGVVLIIGSVLMFIGAAQGNSNPLKPLGSNVSYQSVGTSTNTATPAESVPFIHVKTIEEVKAEIAKANAQGKTAMLDIFADWCVACTELAEITFPSPQVRKALANTVWIQIDVSDNDSPETARAEKYFSYLGLPAVLFFNTKGEEIRNKRVQGFLSPDDFAKRVNEAFAQ